MKRFFFSLFVFCSIGVHAAVPQKQAGATNNAVATNAVVVQPVEENFAETALSALEAGDISGAENLLSKIKNPAGKLYVQACIERAKGIPKVAIRTIANGIALYYRDPDWNAKSELLIAELYFELDMRDQADATARQMQLMYPETDVVKQADALRSKIEKLKETAKE